MGFKLDLDAAMLQAGFVPDSDVGGYRKRTRVQDPNSNYSRVEDLWVSEIQARAALAAAEHDVSWTEDDIEPLSETLARSLKESGIE